LEANRWRLPARGRNTLPLAVILNRLATDFRVLTALARRINSISQFKRTQNIYLLDPISKRELSQIAAGSWADFHTGSFHEPGPIRSGKLAFAANIG
jgi:hypothetical protein